MYYITIRRACMDAVTDNEDIYVLPTELAKLVVRSVYHNFWDDAGYTQAYTQTLLILEYR